MAGDYRKINENTPTDRFGIPLPDDLFQKVKNATQYSKVDLRQGFMQIPMEESHQHYTAFWWNNEVWQYTRCPYGMKNSPAHFQRVMNQAILRAGLTGCAVCYIDDILIFSDTFEEHLVHIAQVLDMLKDNGLRAHPEKSVFGCSVLEYIGHDISCYGITPNEAKVQAIRTLPDPTGVESLRRVLGFANYYRVYVPGYSELAHPLNQLLGKDVKWDWDTNPARAAAWSSLKEALCKPGNALRRADPEKQYILHTDWSKKGLSAVLGQMGDNQAEYLVACTSRSNNKHEAQYGSYKGEMMAAVWGIRTFRHYLHGAKHPFILYTDHKALLWLMKAQSLDGQYARWACLIGDFDFVVVYRPGAEHVLADVPSRNPLPTTVDETGAREDVPRSRYLLLEAEELQGIPCALAAAMVTEEVARVCRSYLDEAGATGGKRQNVEPGAGDGEEFGQVCTAAAGEWPGGDGQGEEQTARFYDRARVIEYEVAFSATQGVMDGYDIGRDDQYGCGIAIASEEEASMTDHQEVLQRFATSHVESIRPALDLVKESYESRQAGHMPSGTGQSAAQLLLESRRRFNSGSKLFTSIESSPLNASVLQDGLQNGVTVLELFGGMASGLEMALRNGIVVSKYIYCDKSKDATAVARLRLETLTTQYPNQLQREAWQGAFTTIPQDVFQIRRKDLIKAGALGQDQQWILIGGFECQDLSPAGIGLGFEGKRSISFFPLVNIIGMLQDLQSHRPPVYIVENTAMMEGKTPPPRVRVAYQVICSSLGQPVIADAARFGSHAHRLRNYWTNLAAADVLQIALDAVERDPAVDVSSILPLHLETQECGYVNSPPWYQANVLGEKLKVLPTLVATEGSYAFRGNGPGLLWDRGRGELVKIPLEARELALGYHEGATAASGVTESCRHRVIGSAFDANVMQCLWAVATAIGRVPQLQVYCGLTVSPGDPDLELQTGGEEEEPEQLSEELLANMFEAQVQESAFRSPDIWQDRIAIQFLQTREVPVGAGGAERDRIRHRVQHYRFSGLELQRHMKDGTYRVVPRPEQRRELVVRIHSQYGHFGQRRTTQLVLLHHWWPGLYKDCAKVVQECRACDRVQASFNSIQPVLSPLAIRGLMYRWGVDLFGPFPKSKRGFKWCMVGVDYFSKWIEGIPMTSKSSAEVAYHLLYAIISRYGAPAEIVTDGGGEFAGEVEDLLRRCLIDHRITSAQHPQANGLAERAVGTLKRCLKRHVATTKDVENWDEYLQWILMAYRATLQSSTKFSPYHLLYAVRPGISSESREVMEEPVDFDDEEAAVESILLRAKILEESAHAAGHNLHIAQQRDTLRYARTRSGGYVPDVQRFKVGDYVYTKKLVSRGRGARGSAPKAREEILRVQDVRESGVLILVGADGKTISENAINCSPCHLTIKSSPVVEALLKAQARPSIDLPCEICLRGDRAASMLLCDGCQKGYHLACLVPALTKVPVGDWWCSNCELAGVPLSSPRVTQEEGEQEEYLGVEMVRSHRKSKKAGGGLEYQIRWKGFKAKDDTWEPASNITPDLLEEYHRRPEVKAKMVAAVASVQPDISKEELASLGYRGLADFKSGEDMRWTSGQQAKTVLGKLLPGSWESSDASDLGHHCPRGCKFNVRAGTLGEISAQAARVLHQALDYGQLSTVVTMHAPALGASRSVLGMEQVYCWNRKTQTLEGTSLSNRWVDTEWEKAKEIDACDVTLPNSFKLLQKEFAPQLIVVVPSVELIDIIFPLAVRTARQMVCGLVPTSWRMRAEGPRADWIANLKRYCNLRAIAVPATGGQDQAWEWLVVDRLAEGDKQ